MRRKGTGNINKRKSGRYSARIMGFSLGTYETRLEAERALLDFQQHRCPYCRREFDDE